MRSTVLIGIASLMIIGAASAQPIAGPSATRPETQSSVPTPPTNSNASPAAPKASERAATAPATGANMLTEAQAKSMIESEGYNQVRDLAKDPTGKWRGMAMKEGKPVDITLDTDGKVVIR